jgi:hypothetical protein
MWKHLSLFFTAEYSKALKEDWRERHILDPDLATLLGGLSIVLPPLGLIGYYLIFGLPEEITTGIALQILVMILFILIGVWLMQLARRFFDNYLHFCALLHLNPKDTSGWKKWGLTDLACKKLEELGRDVAAAQARAEVDGKYGIGGTNVPAQVQDRLAQAYATFLELGVIGEVGVEKFILTEKEHAPT